MKKNTPTAAREVTRESFLNAVVSVTNYDFSTGDNSASYWAKDADIVQGRLGNSFSRAVNRVFESGPVPLAAVPEQLHAAGAADDRKTNSIIRMALNHG